MIKNQVQTSPFSTFTPTDFLVNYFHLNLTLQDIVFFSSPFNEQLTVIKL